MVVIRNLFHTYSQQGRANVDALQAVNVSVNSGEFVALVGPSGCGKSTLLHIIAGLLKPSSGNILIDGLTPNDATKKRQLSFVFQDSVLFPWRTTLQNIHLPIEITAENSTNERHLQQLVEMVDLVGFEHSYPRELSGGMRSRVAIARALALSPTLMLMDEPFGSLDELTAHSLNIKLLRVWTKIKPTVIFVTHNINEAVFLSDRILIMSPRPGKIVDDIPVNLARPRTDMTLESDDFFHTSRQVRKSLRTTLTSKEVNDSYKSQREQDS